MAFDGRTELRIRRSRRSRSPSPPPPRAAPLCSAHHPAPQPASPRSVFGFRNFAFSRRSLNGRTQDVAFESGLSLSKNGLTINRGFCANPELVPFSLSGSALSDGVLVLCLTLPPPKHTGWFLSRSTCSCWVSQVPSESRRAAQVVR